MAANMVAVSLGTETDGSILCPASVNSVVGVKPTVGLTSRAEDPWKLYSKSLSSNELQEASLS